MPANSYKNLTASGQIKAGFGRLVGMYVNSTSGGTVKLWNSLSATGDVMNNTITPAVGYHKLGNAAFTTGCYATLGGTIDVTFYYA